MIHSCQKIVVLLLVSLLWSCTGDAQPATPLETLKAYSIAVRKKDTTMMKLLLSEATLKVHQEQAKVQNVTLDEIVERETLFPKDQRVFKFRQEKIDGDKATVEVQNNYGSWDMIFLVKEDGAWKIDKKGFADQMTEQIEDDVQMNEDQNEADRQKIEEMADQQREADSDASPEASPENTNDPTESTPPADSEDPVSPSPPVSSNPIALP